jgi:hypothetical protein
MTIHPRTKSRPTGALSVCPIRVTGETPQDASSCALALQAHLNGRQTEIVPVGDSSEVILFIRTASAAAA